jgi:diguanylate cyclase (GGDEF)-like protein
MSGGVNLDVPTLLIVSAMVISLTGILFIVDAYSRKDDVVGRIWSLAYVSGIITTFAYLASAAYGAIWWGIGLGNGTVVFSLGAVWAGARVFNGRRSLLWVAGAASVAVAVLAIVRGPGGGEWAGGDAMIAGMFIFGFAGGIECFRGRLWRFRNARFLGAIMLIAGAYYGVRLIFYVAVGPLSSFFITFLGTGITSLVVIMFVTGGAFAMVALRGEESRLIFSADGASAAPSSTANVAEFADVVAPILRMAQQGASPVSLVAVDIDELATLNSAFGRAYGDQVLVRFVEELRAGLPAGTPLCRLGGDHFAFLLADIDGQQAARRSEEIRSSLLESPLIADQTRVRVTASFGIATGDGCGYALDAMIAAANGALTVAKAAGRNRVELAAR